MNLMSSIKAVAGAVCNHGVRAGAAAAVPTGPVVMPGVITGCALDDVVVGAHDIGKRGGVVVVVGGAAHDIGKREVVVVVVGGDAHIGKRGGWEVVVVVGAHVVGAHAGKVGAVVLRFMVVYILYCSRVI